MAKGENDLSERTLGERLDGIADRQDGLGKRSPVKRATRKAAPAAEPDMKDVLARQFLAGIQTDLRARDGAGRPVPTLQDRIRKEGYKAQLGEAGQTRVKAGVKAGSAAAQKGNGKMKRRRGRS